MVRMTSGSVVQRRPVARILGAFPRAEVHPADSTSRYRNASQHGHVANLHSHLGRGRQSPLTYHSRGTAMALCRGEFPPLDTAIFHSSMASGHVCHYPHLFLERGAERG